MKSVLSNKVAKLLLVCLICLGLAGVIAWVIEAVG